MEKVKDKVSWDKVKDKVCRWSQEPGGAEGDGKR